jgi:hypothetical protein
MDTANLEPCSQHSTEHAILAITDKIQNAIENRN